MFKKYGTILVLALIAATVWWRMGSSRGETMKTAPREAAAAASPAGSPAAPTPAPEKDPANATSPAAATTPPAGLLGTLVSTEGVPLAVSAVAEAHAKGRIAIGRIVTFDTSAVRLQDLQQGQSVDIPLPGGGAVRGVVNLVQSAADGVVRVGGALEGNRGSFSLTQETGNLTGSVLLRPNALAYVLTSSGSNRSEMREVTVADVICFPFARDSAEPEPQSAAAGPPVQESILPLQSRPGAAAVLYLDFDGATVTDPRWPALAIDPNDPDEYIVTGPTIVAPGSSLTNAQITEVWNRVKEDFSPFNINITTVESDYTAAAVNRRMRVIITPNDAAAPGSGGVAYIESFAGKTQYGFTPDIPAWVFNVTPNGIAEAISHELGHTLGLHHDGRTSPPEEYYEGHGTGVTSWAPIMGAGYYSDVVQWSKGEYPNANRGEYDVEVVSGVYSTPFSTSISHPLYNNTGFVADEAGDYKEVAASLNVTSGSATVSGIISRDSDSDFYRVVLSSATSATITVTPPTAYPKQANLDAALELQDGTGAVLATSKPNATLSASITRTLLAGTYYVKIYGSDRAPNGADYGYTNYGSIGQYTLAYTSTPSVPTITSQTTGLQVIAPGASTTLSVSAASVNGAISYQWMRNGWPVAGAINANLVLSNATADNSGVYWVVLINTAGLNRSAPIFVRVVPATTQIVAWGDNTYGQTTIPSGLNRVAETSVGHWYAMALKSNGVVEAWGTNNDGVLNLPSTGEVGAISAGTRYGFALKTDGTVAAWGLADSNGLTTVPAGLANVFAIEAGENHMLAAKTDGTVVAWGNNSYGQCTVPAGLTGVVAVAAGAAHSLALKNDGTVVAWGSNIYGATTVPAGLTGVVAIGAGWNSSLALKSDGTLVAWGRLPLETLTSIANVKAISLNHITGLALKADGSVAGLSYDTGVPSVPSGLTNVVGITAGGLTKTSMVVRDISPVILPVITSHPASQPVDEGANATFTMAANGTPAPSYQWQRFPAAGSSWSNVSNGGIYSGATTASLTITGALLAGNGDQFRCVATNSAGSATTNAATLTVLPTAPIVTPAVRRTVVEPGQGVNLNVAASGPGTFTYQWFHNGQSIAGATGSSLSIATSAYQDGGWYVVDVTNSNGTTRSAPMFVTVAPLKTQVVPWEKPAHWLIGSGSVLAGLGSVNDAVSIGVGYQNLTLAIRRDGSLAINSSFDFYTYLPLPTSASGFVAAIGSAGSSAVALRGDGTVIVWGNNNILYQPVGLTDVVAIAGGYASNYALRSNGTVVGWQVNTGASLNFVAGLTDVIGIAASGYALKADGTVVPMHSGLASAPEGLSNVVAIDGVLNGEHTLALKSDGTVVAWGNNNLGQATVPAGLNSVRAIAAGYGYSLALKNDGTVVSWGTVPYGAVPAGLTGVFAIAADQFATAALRDATNDIAPAITVQPQAATTRSTGSTTYTVAATGTTQLNYQWQIFRIGASDWSSIQDQSLSEMDYSFSHSGTQTPTLTVTGVREPNSGNQYRCLVVNAAGTAISNPALLTVVPVTASGNAIGYNATNFPASAVAGSTVTFNYNVTNVGTKAWGGNHYLTLRNQGGTYLYYAALGSVAAGGSKVASLSFTAPSSAGTYTYYLQAIENGLESFGAEIPVTLTVVVPTNAITYNTTTFPTTAAPGAVVSFTYNVTNTGAQGWGGNHWLTLRDSGGTYLYYASLASVATSGSKTASFSFTAPSTPGTYTYYLRAMENGVEFFGAQMPLTLTVAAPANAIAYNTTTFPATASAGSTVSFTYNVTNTGAQGWGGNHWLTLRDSGGTYLYYASLASVATSGSKTASFSFTAPSTPGTYTYYLQAMQNGVEFFGAQVPLTLTVTSAVTVNGNGIRYNSNTFPTSAEPSGEVTFSCNVTNTGTKAWGANHYLTLRDQGGNYLDLPALAGVAINGTVVVNFRFAAPVTPGTYTYYIEAAENGVEVFGSNVSKSLTVAVVVTGQGNAIQYATTTFPTTAVPGQVVTFSYNVTNAGTRAWGANHYLTLRNSGGTYLYYASLASVAAGGNKTANFSFTAPSSPGTYTYYVKALENGLELFGAQVPLTLTVAAAPANAISYGTTTLPTSAAAGATVSFTYNVTNTGTQAWGANHWLTLWDANGNCLYYSSISAVAASGSKTASFSFKAPSTPGSYTYYVQALENGVEVFGSMIPLNLTVP